MEAVDITAELRSEKGKGASRRMRRQGRVPAIFYGPKRQTVSISVDATELLRKVLRVEGAHLIRLRSQSPELEERIALLNDHQLHPVTGEVLHADLYEVDLTEKLETSVPLHFVGKAIGVARDGGIMQPVRREIDVRCLPTDIPEFIEVDVSELGIHDNIHINDLKLPESVELMADDNYTLVTVLPPTVEEVKVEEAAVVAAEGEAAPAPEGGEAPAAEAEKKSEKKGEKKKEES